MLVHVFNHIVHILVVLEGIHVSEVVSKEDENVVGEVMLSLGIKIISEHFTLGVCIEVLGFLVVDPLGIAVKNIEVEIGWGTVVGVKSMGENLSVSSETFCIRSPDELHLLVVHSLLLVTVVKPREEPGIEAHLGENSSVGVRVAERIDLPTDVWLDPEFLEDPLVTNNMVIDHVLISGAGFIVHGPSSVDDLQLSIGDKFLNLCFLGVILLVPPHFEKFHLYFRKFSCRIVLESIHDGGKF